MPDYRGRTDREVNVRPGVVHVFERFADSARRVVLYAREEARLLDHNYIGTEHLLLGMLHRDSEPAVQALTAVGADLEAAREQAEEIVGRGQETPAGDIPFTPRAKKVLELSLRESLQLGHDHIGSEHILLGLLREGEGVGAEILERLGIDLAELRRQVVTLLQGRRERFGPRGGPAPGAFTAIESRLAAIEERLGHIERLLEDGSGRGSA